MRVQSQSSAVKSADENDLVALLQHVVAFAFELPVSVVDENEDARTTVGSRQGMERRWVVSIVSIFPGWHSAQHADHTHTESPSTKSSSRSAIKWLRMWLMRKVTLVSLPFASRRGNVSWCLFSCGGASSSSVPPPNSTLTLTVSVDMVGANATLETTAASRFSVQRCKRQERVASDRCKARWQPKGSNQPWVVESAIGKLKPQQSPNIRKASFSAAVGSWPRSTLSFSQGPPNLECAWTSSRTMISPRC